MKVTLARSIELLTELAELQNGPPLVRYEKQWNETMENVWEFIHNYEKRFCLSQIYTIYGTSKTVRNYRKSKKQTK